MNSRAGQYQYINSQIQIKKSVLIDLEQEREFYK